jgi:PIN domain nuclease of toxin-antitoxin system
VRLLLDTHVALWFITDAPRLSDVARTLIMDAENDVFVSIATVWEIAIKHTTPRGPEVMPLSGTDALAAFRGTGFHIIDITPADIAALESLPLLHRDPFDRILVAQAMSGPFRLLTRDRKIAAYSDTIIAV